MIKKRNATGQLCARIVRYREIGLYMVAGVLDGACVQNQLWLPFFSRLFA